LKLVAKSKQNVNRNLHSIIRLWLAILPVLLTMAPAMAQMNYAYVGQTSELSVVEMEGDTYMWELYNDPNVDFATDPGNCPPTEAYFVNGTFGPTVTVMWLQEGIYFFKVTAYGPTGCMNLKVGMVTVINSPPGATIDEPPPICPGDTAILVIHLTGTAPWSIDLYDGTHTVTYDNIMDNTFYVPVSPPVTTSYTVTRVQDAYGEVFTPSNTVTLVVKPLPVNSRIYQYNP
jgi:hypothetical protein